MVGMTMKGVNLSRLALFFCASQSAAAKALPRFHNAQIKNPAFRKAGF